MNPALATADPPLARGAVPNQRAYRSAAARAPSRSPARRRRAISPLRQPESATTPSTCSSSSAWLKRGALLEPATLALSDAAEVLLDRLPVTGQAGPVGPRARRATFAGGAGGCQLPGRQRRRPRAGRSPQASS